MIRNGLYFLGKNGGMEKINEIFTITQEECAEVIQVISKIQRFGLGNRYLRSEAGITNTDALTQEVGDLLAMIDLLVTERVLDADQLEQAKMKKIEKLRTWSNIFK
jgi:NTP pyrophosphatase (non-canonical NTP hydrolase)